MVRQTSVNHIAGLSREQKLLLPEAVEDYIAADHPVRFIDALVNALDLRALGFGKAVAQRVKAGRDIMKLRKAIVEHPFGTIKRTMNAGYFLCKRLAGVGAEMSLTVLAYNLKRALNIVSFAGLIKAVTVNG
ncbi:MAG: transposase [Pedosphaera sp.]|nr:transposase [Pedosphaera sp.]